MRESVKKRIFSKVIVVFCVAEMAFMQFWAMRIASHNMFLVTGLLTANHSVFGGELLLLCLKRILVKDGKNNFDKSDEKEEKFAKIN